MKTLVFENVFFAYNREHPVFEDLSVTIQQRVPGKGHIACLMGKSGSGKSTFFKLVLQLEKPQRGKVGFTPASPVYAFLPQEPMHFEHLSIAENSRYLSRLKTYRGRFDERLYGEVAGLLELDAILPLKRKITELSGGQQQKISLLRALSIRPDVLLLDEPTNGLDSAAKIQFLQLLKQLVIKYDLLVIYITHNRTEAEIIADELLFFQKEDPAGPVQRVFQGNLNEFTGLPPHLELLKVFKYPAPVLIRCRMDGTMVLPVNTGEAAEFTISLEPGHLSVNGASGIPFELLSASNLYDTIGLDGTEQHLTLPATVLQGAASGYLQINGLIPAYGPDQVFLKNIQLMNNRIVE